MSWFITYVEGRSAVRDPEVQSRDAAAAARAFSAATDIFEHSDFELFLAAYDRYSNRSQSLHGSNLQGRASPLTAELAGELILDVHGLLGALNVLVDGEGQKWLGRVKNGQQYRMKYEQACRDEQEANPAFGLLLSLRNHSQHEAQVPLAFEQRFYGFGQVVALDLRVNLPPKALRDFPEAQRDLLSELHYDFGSLLRAGYRSLDYLDSLNREMLLEVVAERIEIARAVVDLTEHDRQGRAAVLSFDQRPEGTPPVRIPTSRELDLLVSLAALPDYLAIRFPRPKGPGFWVQGKLAETLRPLLDDPPHAVGQGEVPWWSFDLDRARREL